MIIDINREFLCYNSDHGSVGIGKPQGSESVLGDSHSESTRHGIPAHPGALMRLRSLGSQSFECSSSVCGELVPRAPDCFFLVLGMGGGPSPQNQKNESGAHAVHAPLGLFFNDEPSANDGVRPNAREPHRKGHMTCKPRLQFIV